MGKREFSMWRQYLFLAFMALLVTVGVAIYYGSVPYTLAAFAAMHFLLKREQSARELL